MQVHPVSEQPSTDAICQSSERLAGVERHVLTVLKTVVVPSLRSRSRFWQKHGGADQRVREGKKAADLLARVHHMLKHLECGHSLPRASFWSHRLRWAREEVVAVRIAQPKIESAISKKPDQQTIATAVVQKAAIGVGADPDDRLGAVGKLHVPRQHPQILPSDRGCVGTLKPVRFLGLNEATRDATEVSSRHVSENPSFTPRLNPRFTDRTRDGSARSNMLGSPLVHVGRVTANPTSSIKGMHVAPSRKWWREDGQLVPEEA